MDMPRAPFLLPRPLPVLLVLIVLLGVRSGVGAAEELRLRDGEILHGDVLRDEEGILEVRTATGLRRIAAGEIGERLAGRSSLTVLRARWAALRDAGPGAESEREDLVWALYRMGLDDEARSWADVLLAEDAERPALQSLRGRVREAAGWGAGWALPGGVPNLVSQRWGAARRKAQAAGGASAATEGAVSRALAWLAAHQDPDGKLDADGFQRHDPPDDPCDGQGGGHHGERVPCGYDGVTTAVALMAWLASGSTPRSGPYAKNVAAALQVCLQTIESGPGSSYGLWNHGFCTQAVADAYAVTRVPALRVALQRAVDAMLRLQRSDGGWSYYLPIGDVPTTGVVGTALALALRAGIALPKEAVTGMLAFLDERVDGEKGRSTYHRGAERKGYTPTRANTAAGLSVRGLLGVLGEARLRDKQVAALGGRTPVWKLSYKDVKTGDGRTVRAQVGTLYPYLWYYSTLALFARGGSTWSGWFGGLKRALLKGQRRDGSAAGSWDPLGTYSDSAGRVFITGLCALMLQTPYRYARAP
jgi:hypothetical protein